MGQGSKTSADIRKTSPRRARRLRGEEGGGGAGLGGGSRPDYCQLAHTLAVEIRSGASLSVGAPVELVLANPPRVRSHGVEVGEVDDAKARAMERCMIEGYLMAGRVRKTSAGGRRAEIVVSGTSGA